MVEDKIFSIGDRLRSLKEKYKNRPLKPSELGALIGGGIQAINSVRVIADPEEEASGKVISAAVGIPLNAAAGYGIGKLVEIIRKKRSNKK